MGRRLLAPAACLALIAAAPEPPGPSLGLPLDSLFESADRGELGPIVRALEMSPDGDVRALLQARLAAARLDPAAARDPALTRLAIGGDPAERRAALSVMASVAFAEGDYAEAARTGELLERALSEAGDAEMAESVGRMRGLAALLNGRPMQRVEGSVVPASTASHYDRVGLPRIEVRVNGQAQEAVVDTGANLSVLSRETARRMGLEIAETETRVSNGVQGTVGVRIGVADRLEIAGTVLRNVPFLIIDDEHLTFRCPAATTSARSSASGAARAGADQGRAGGAFLGAVCLERSDRSAQYACQRQRSVRRRRDRRHQRAAPSRHRRKPDHAQRALCRGQSGRDRGPSGRGKAVGERRRDAECAGRHVAGRADRTGGDGPWSCRPCR
jgi:hypothetical protein